MAQPQPVIDIEELVGHVVESTRVGADAALCETGATMPPVMFMLNEQLDSPLLAQVVTRLYHPGEDAEAAITGLGVLPAQLGATRLVVAIELQELRAAVGAATDPDGMALIVVDAGLHHQCVHWYPLGLRPAPQGAVTPEWGTPTRLPGRSAPPPIDDLLDTWKQLRAEAAGVGIEKTVRAMEAVGYKIHWFTH